MTFKPLADEFVDSLDEMRYDCEYPYPRIQQQLKRANSLAAAARLVCRHLPPGPKERLELAIAQYYGEV